MNLANSALFECVEVRRISAGVVAGTTDVTCTIVDMAGYDAIAVMALVGVLTATQVTALRLRQGDLANGSDAADIPGAVSPNLLDTDDDLVCMVEVVQPRERYITAVVDRATANAVVDGVVAFLYRARSKVTQGATVAEYVKVLGTAS